MLEGCSNISECEKILNSSIQKIDLLSDISLSSEDVGKLQGFIFKSVSIDIRECTEFLKDNAPTSLACYLVWNGILHYREGDFWTSIGKNTGLSDPNWQSKWGNIFLHVLKNRSFINNKLRFIPKSNKLGLCISFSTLCTLQFPTHV